MPKKWGGMGVAQMETRNEALVLRWWWKLHTEPQSLWSVFVARIHCFKTREGGPIICKIGGSFFWKYLLQLRKLFQWSTVWCIGDIWGQDLFLA